MKQARLAFRLALPAAYRAADFLAFHRRDTAATAERVAGNTLLKGIVWAGRPACSAGSAPRKCSSSSGIELRNSPLGSSRTRRAARFRFSAVRPGPPSSSSGSGKPVSVTRSAGTPYARSLRRARAVGTR